MVMTHDRKLLFVANIDVADANCDPNHVIANPFCNEVRAFTVNSDGTLSALGNPLPVSAPSATQLGMQMGLAVGPTNALLFATTEGNAGALGQPQTIPGSISILKISSAGLPSTFTTVSSTAPNDFTGNGPSAVAVAPVGDFIYVANQFTNSVAVFPYDPTAGTIATPPIASYSTGANPVSVAFSRCAGGTVLNSNCTASDGDNLFVANSGISNNVSIFAACIEVTPTCSSADGSLQAVNNSPVSAGLGPSSIVVSPQLDFVYVVDTQSNEVSQFSYGPATGSLSALSPPVISTGSAPVSGGITSDGSIVIVPNSGSSNVEVFKVNNLVSTTGAAPTGRLSRATSSTFTLANQPSAVIVR